jgi:hypothetical protein
MANINLALPVIMLEWAVCFHNNTLFNPFINWLMRIIPTVAPKNFWRGISIAATCGTFHVCPYVTDTIMLYNLTLYNVWRC